MSNLVLMAAVFLGSFVVGYLLISRIPPLLHTPLMSMTNAISAVTILGALILFSFPTTTMEKVLGAVALMTATFNVVGGFVITDKMLKLFKGKKQDYQFSAKGPVKP
ncbi:MAG TPA: NAD(P)(+) transhydrogenase [Desulfobulbaceae bacterium]|nr:NAD(P)(+) transhydrogenase [Desulfobulbaceae bacterium]